jgi:hypothetical protein
VRQPADWINECALQSTISEDERPATVDSRAQIYFNDAKIFGLPRWRRPERTIPRLVSKPHLRLTLVLSQARQVQFVGWAGPARECNAFLRHLAASFFLML